MPARFALALALVAVVFAGCGGKQFVGTSLSRSQTSPTLAGTRVYITFQREHSAHYETDGGIIPTLLGVGDHDNHGEHGETTRVDRIGAVEIDLVAGTCRRVPVARPQPGTSTYKLPPLQVLDRVYVAERYAVLEQTLAGDKVKRHRPGIAIPHEEHATWLAPVRWEVGETYRGLTLEQTPDGFALAGAGRRLELGASPGIVYHLADTDLAAADGLLIDLDRLVTRREAEGYPRVARYGEQGLLIESDGRYWTTDLRLGGWSSISTQLDPIGVADGAFVFHRRDVNAIVTFAGAQRGWRRIDYGPCVPDAP